MQSVTKSPVAYVKKSTNPKEDDFVFALFFHSAAGLLDISVNYKKMYITAFLHGERECPHYCAVLNHEAVTGSQRDINLFYNEGARKLNIHGFIFSFLRFYVII